MHIRVLFAGTNKPGVSGLPVRNFVMRTLVVNDRRVRQNEILKNDFGLKEVGSVFSGWMFCDSVYMLLTHSHSSAKTKLENRNSNTDFTAVSIFRSPTSGVRTWWYLCWHLKPHSTSGMRTWRQRALCRHSERYLGGKLGFSWQERYFRELGDPRLPPPGSRSHHRLPSASGIQPNPRSPYPGF